MERRKIMPGVNCCECLPREHTEWSVLSDEELNLLTQAKKCRKYHSGESIFAIGEPSYGVYCIVSGGAAVRKIDAAGNSILLHLVYPGGTLGYRGVLLDEERRSSAEALGPSKICFIDRHTVQTLLERNPTLGQQFLRRVVTDVDDAHDKLVRNATLSNRTKFVHLLLALMNRHGRTTTDGSRVMELPLSRRDLASMIGARHETLSRIIGRLEEDGVARFSGRTVCVTRPHSLIDEIRPTLLS
ncbi:MAG TPA: Crp/Fnr family transcriptional regulator [Candidatus Competibacter phosphatis]|nr:Crp/Fnr family transcriptional regulator [Candidatus Competibacter phosphatis]